MSFSGITIVKIVTEETPQEFFTWSFDIKIFIYVIIFHELGDFVSQGLNSRYDFVTAVGNI